MDNVLELEMRLQSPYSMRSWIERLVRKLQQGSDDTETRKLLIKICEQAIEQERGRSTGSRPFPAPAALVEACIALRDTQLLYDAIISSASDMQKDDDHRAVAGALHHLPLVNIKSW